MKSMQSLLRSLYEALNGIENLECYHYEKAEDCSVPYAVWQEDGEDSSFHANNRKEEQTIIGSLDYFTQEEFDSVVDDIQETLNGICAWTLDSVQYEDETKLIHYSWRWELV